MQAAAAQAPSAPRVVGRYAIYGEIASGGMATVHFGRMLGQVGFARIVAIKRLHPQFAKDPEFVAMFIDEAKLAARIQHPNVVSTLDIVRDGDELILVMQYVQGESLSRLLKALRRADKRLPSQVALSVVASALHGLHAAHEARSENGVPLNIVHRDVSPQNIIVGSDGVSRVLDFGVAKAAMRATSTRNGQIKGKVSYMAPEQFRLQDVDRRTDIFAAGVVLWESLTGRRLFDGQDPAQVMTKLLELEIPKPSEVESSVDSDLDAIVLKALERDPQKRYATAREFAIALENAGKLALPREVGEWVEQEAEGALQKRREQIAQIEQMPSSVGTPQGPVQEDSEGSSSRVIPAEHARLSNPEVDPSSFSQSAVSVHQSASMTMEAPRSGKLMPILLGIGLAVFLAGAVAVGLLVLKLVRGPGASVEGVDMPAASSKPEVKVVPSPPAKKVEPKKVVEPAVSASAPPSASTAKKVAPKPHWIRRTPPPATAKQPKKPAANCNPPYVLDDKGIRRIKPECM